MPTSVSPPTASTLPTFTIGRSAATVSLRSGKMLADIAELEIDDGTRGGGQIRIDMSGANPSYDVQAKFESADVGRSVQAVFGHPTVQGRGSITVDLTATGNTGESLLRSLGGKLCVILAEGGRVGLDVNKLAAASEPLPEGAWQEVSARGHLGRHARRALHRYRRHHTHAVGGSGIRRARLDGRRRHQPARPPPRRGAGHRRHCQGR